MGNFKGDPNDIISLIELASDTQTARTYINEYTSFENDSERLTFLKENFNIKIIGRCDTDENYTEDMRLADDYEAVLGAVIGRKLRV